MLTAGSPLKQRSAKSTPKGVGEPLVLLAQHTAIQSHRAAGPLVKDVEPHRAEQSLVGVF